MMREIEDFLYYSKIERGLSQNTIIAYQRDLNQYVAYPQEEGINSWSDIDVTVVKVFLRPDVGSKQISRYYYKNDFDVETISSIYPSRTDHRP